MTIYELLKQDHERAKKLMEKIKALDSQETEKRDELFNQLKEELLIHAKAEEKAFYSPLSKHKLTAEEIEHAKKEHKEVEMMLDQLSNKKLNGAAWTQLFEKMCDSVKHHIKEEEGEMFTDAKKEISMAEADIMEKNMEKQKQVMQKEINIPLR